VAPQLVHELPVPAMGADTPESLLEKQAKVDRTRSAVFSHCGHGTFSSALLNGRKSSNFEPQLAQAYSYIGIFLS
jgi:hypothetical protein